MTSKSPRRRDVLRGATAAAFLPSLSFARGLQQDQVLRVAVVGVRSRGMNHVNGYINLPNARVVAICDVDAQVLERRRTELAEKGVEVETFEDIRDLLARDDIDAVSLATPNHLHALHTIWACEAGKDVYVEKPVSHNLWEGRRMVEVARRTGRIVQTGTQSRSSAAIAQAIEWLQGGGLGAPRFAQGLCYKPRNSIGKVDVPQAAPEHINHDLCPARGPTAPSTVASITTTGTGSGPSARGTWATRACTRWTSAAGALGAKRLPTRVMTVGGRWGYVDDGTTPNTMIAYYELDPAPMVFEVRGLPKDKASREGGWGGGKMDKVFGTSISAIVHAEEGTMVFPNYSSAVAYDAANNEVQRWREGGDHFANFVNAALKREGGDLNAQLVDATSRRATATSRTTRTGWVAESRSPGSGVRSSTTRSPRTPSIA